MTWVTGSTGSPGHMVLGSLGRWVTKCDPVPCLIEWELLCGSDRLSRSRWPRGTSSAGPGTVGICAVLDWRRWRHKRICRSRLGWGGRVRQRSSRDWSGPAAAARSGTRRMRCSVQRACAQTWPPPSRWRHRADSALGTSPGDRTRCLFTGR